MPTTTDPNASRLEAVSIYGTGDQNQVYLVLSEQERAKGFVRSVHRSYKHVGKASSRQLRDLTDEEKERYAQFAYVKFEPYPPSELPVTGRFWTQAMLDSLGCGTVTTIHQAIAETYARQPDFYGATYCAHCHKHLPVEEFIWVDDETRVGS